MRIKLSRKGEIAVTSLGNEYSIWIDGEQVTAGAVDAVGVRGLFISLDLLFQLRDSVPLRLSAN
jgi:hypothetical protein